MRCGTRLIWGGLGELSFLLLPFFFFFFFFFFFPFSLPFPAPSFPLLQPTLTVCIFIFISITRKKYTIGMKLRARLLTTIPDSTSQKFILFGQVSKRDQNQNDKNGPVAVVFLDFAGTRSRQCGEGDFEDWQARSASHECLK